MEITLNHINYMDSQKPKKKKEYINNNDFLLKLKKFKSEYKKGLVKKVPEDIAQMIYEIAVNLAKSPKFNGYTYKDEMISDAVLNCLEKIHNFSPRKSSNPFSYFTQISYFAFVRRIKGENKHSYIKNKVMQDFMDNLYKTEKKIKNKKLLHYETQHENWGKIENEVLGVESKKEKKNGKK